MKPELFNILKELIQKAKNNSQHEASYDLIGKVKQSDEVKPYLNELIKQGYIKNVNVMGHTYFICKVTDKSFEEFEREEKLW